MSFCDRSYHYQRSEKVANGRSYIQCSFSYLYTCVLRTEINGLQAIGVGNAKNVANVICRVDGI